MIYVLEFFNYDLEKARIWFTTPNPMFGDLRPLDLIILGRSHVLEKFIENAKEENFGEKAKKK